MPEFVLLCRDKENSLELRMKTREAHLAYVGKAIVEVLLAGPLLDDQQNPAGSLFIINAASQSDVRAFAKSDPYAKAGLFQSVEIQPYKLVAGTFLAK